MELILKVYNENDEIKKEVKAEFIDIKMGTIRSLMKLLKVDDLDDTTTLLKIVYEAWEELIKILNKVFPEMEEDDWEYVNVSELLPIVVEILKGSFSKILQIPNNSKN